MSMMMMMLKDTVQIFQKPVHTIGLLYSGHCIAVQKVGVLGRLSVLSCNTSLHFKNVRLTFATAGALNYLIITTQVVHTLSLIHI